jgi:hypothetical protein
LPTVPTLSACIIARDEEARLPAALASVAFCDEVVVVDSGSADRTRDVARAAGARVIEHPWQGFPRQRNVAIDHAAGDWILEIDADERVSPELRDSIRAFLAGPHEPGYDIACLPLRQRFLGRDLGPSARYPGYRARLFRRGAYRHDETRLVHEGLWPAGPAMPLDGDLVHLLADSWREALGDAARYARLDAGQLAGARRAREFVAGIVLRPVVKLAWRLVVYGAWRDGAHGLAKILLDAGTDAAVWGIRLFRAPVAAPRAGVPSGHFAPVSPATGPVKLVGLARRAGEAEALAAWLRRAGAAGADVALVAPPGAAADGVRVRPLDGRGPLAVVRALDAENQLRAADALVLARGPARAATAFVPSTLRGPAAPLTTAAAPEQAVRQVAVATRG